MHPRTLILTTAQRTELERARDHDHRPYLRECAGALLKIGDGMTAHAVARHGLLKPRAPDTVHRWLTAYAAGGVAGLVHKPRGHRGRSP
jgi:hypothetical protein